MQAYLHAASFGLRRLAIADASPLTTFSLSPDAADHILAGDTLCARFVSDPMDAGNVFTVGQAIKAVVQALEAHASNNLQVQWWVGVCSEDGETLRATLLSKTVAGPEVAAALTSRLLSTTLTGGYTTVAGDRLVVEVGLVGTPVATSGVQGHNGSIRAGGDGIGWLPENDTEVATNLNPWIEFVTNIVWRGRWRLEAYCPLCGLQLLAKTQPDAEKGDPNDTHIHLEFAVLAQCANGHQWSANMDVTLWRVLP